MLRWILAACMIMVYPTARRVPYVHVDVFTNKPFSGNSLTVFPKASGLSTKQMQQLTQEMRHFESIFLLSVAHRTVKARIFTMEEELSFAGHPVLGAAAVLHRQMAVDMLVTDWQFVLASKTVPVRTEQREGLIRATMNQGKAEFGQTLSPEAAAWFWQALNLSPDDAHQQLPVQVVSTGLPYLILPVRQHLDRAQIVVKDLENKLSQYGAKFILVFDPALSEGRTWDNLGLVEDIATGSAAGPAGAYLVNYKVASVNQPITLHQGRFLSRPSQLFVTVQNDHTVWVGGDVIPIGQGYLHNKPAEK